MIPAALIALVVTIALFIWIRGAWPERFACAVFWGLFIGACSLAFTTKAAEPFKPFNRYLAFYEAGTWKVLRSREAYPSRKACEASMAPLAAKASELGVEVIITCHAMGKVA